MKHLLLIFCLALTTTVSSATAWIIPDEVLHYSVRFKWGLVDANVGVAKLSTRNIPDTGRFIATLSGKSIDLFGHYYEAEDTITGSIMSDAVKLNSTQTISQEHGIFDIETIHGNAIKSHVSDYGSGLTTDLLSVFYYMRQINYSDFPAGQDFHINVIDGTQVEMLDITYLGKENLAFGEETFKIYITFTSRDSGKSDSMNVWISTDSQRIPLIINATLSMGHMECHFINSQTLPGGLPD